MIVVMFTRAGVSRRGNNSQVSSSSRRNAPVSADTGYPWMTTMVWFALADASDANEWALNATAVFEAQTLAKLKPP